MTASTLKVNFSPYLIDIVLCGTVDSLRHKAKVRSGVLRITLFKSDDKIWGSLEAPSSVENEVMRQRSLLQQQEIEEKLSESRKERKVADERYSVRKQMALEETERNRLEGKKEEEKHSAEEEMYAAFTKLKSSPLPQTFDSGADSDCAEKCEFSSRNHVQVLQGDIESDRTEDSHTQDSDHVILDQVVHDVPEAEDGDLMYVPPPRSVSAGHGGSSSSRVNVNFTPRVFPTPMRESTQANEEDWIAKNRRHLKKHGTLGKHIPKGS